MKNGSRKIQDRFKGRSRDVNAPEVRRVQMAWAQHNLIGGTVRRSSCRMYQIGMMMRMLEDVGVNWLVGWLVCLE